MSLHRRSLLAGLTTTLVGGCGPDFFSDNTPREGYVLDQDIPFGPHPRLKLDWYKPVAPRPDGKTVVFFYGGGWKRGDKDEFLFVAQALASRGIAVIVPDYRLYPHVRFPTFLEDAALAVAWADAWIGADKLFLMGYSAGAHMAAMLAANTTYLGRVGVNRMRLRGFIGIAGPYDFLPLTHPEAIDLFGGANNPDTQPINFAHAPLPPAFLLHGEDDVTVTPRNSINLAARWQAAGAQVRLQLYPNTNHARIIASFWHRFVGYAHTRSDTLAWISGN